MMRVTLGLATLATVALSQELFLSSPKSCKFAALVGKFRVGRGDDNLEAQVTLDSKTCELSANITYIPEDYDIVVHMVSNFQPVDLSADLLNPLGWRQSGDIAVQGFRATIASRGIMPPTPFDTTGELLGWHDPSTQSLTTFVNVSGYGYWLWVIEAGRGAVSNHRPSPRAAVSEAMTLGPCDKKWSANFKSFLGWFQGHFHVRSTGFGAHAIRSDALNTGFGWITDEDDLCDLKFSMYTYPKQFSTRSANFTNFAEVELSSKMYQELGLSWAADGAPTMAASMEVSTEHGNGSAVMMTFKDGNHGVNNPQRFIYCRYDDNSKEIFHLDFWYY